MNTVPMKSLAIAAAVLVSTATLAQAADGQLPYTYAVSLDAHGQATAVEGPAGVDPAVDVALRDRLAGMRFLPRSAEAATGRTHVRFVLENGRVVSVQSGAAPTSLTVPAYPAKAQRAGQEGLVLLAVDVAADGSVSASKVAGTRGQISREMAEAAVRASHDWRFANEQVDGRPVAAQVLVPVCYFIRQPAAQACEWQLPDATWMATAAIHDRDPAYTLTSGAVAYQPY